MPESTPTVLRAAEVCRMLSVSRTTLWTWTRDGRFPAGCRIGPNTRVWRADVVQGWLDQRFAEAE